MVGSVARLSRRVGEQDADLARQMRRASVSVPLNIQEGLYSLGGNRRARLHDAMGSARETMASLEVCVAAGYVTAAEAAADLDRVDHIIGGLWKLARRRSR